MIAATILRRRAALRARCADFLRALGAVQVANGGTAGSPATAEERASARQMVRESRHTIAEVAPRPRLKIVPAASSPPRRPRARTQRRAHTSAAIKSPPADDGEPPAPRVSVTYAAEDDPMIRSRAISVIRDLLGRSV